MFQHFADGSPVKSSSDPYDVVTSIVYKPPEEDEEQIKAKTAIWNPLSPSPDLSTKSRTPTSRPQTRKARSRSSDSLSTMASEAAVKGGGGGLTSNCRCGTPSSCGVHEPAHQMAQLGQQQQELGSFYYQAPPQPVPMGLCRNCRRIYASSPLLAESQATILQNA